jgi:hypothetical protein
MQVYGDFIPPYFIVAQASMHMKLDLKLLSVTGGMH